MPCTYCTYWGDKTAAGIYSGVCDMLKRTSSSDACILHISMSHFCLCSPLLLHFQWVAALVENNCHITIVVLSWFNTSHSNWKLSSLFCKQWCTFPNLNAWIFPLILSLQGKKKHTAPKKNIFDQNLTSNSDFVDDDEALFQVCGLSDIDCLNCWILILQPTWASITS